VPRRWQPACNDVHPTAARHGGGPEDLEAHDAAQENAMNKKIPTLVGAGIGLALFLAVALLPAMLYGGYAGLLLAGGIFGTPVEPTILPRALIVFGMVLGVVAVGSLFAVLGAAAGAAVGALTSITVRRPASQEQLSQ
jgi:hypothetical protein